MASSSSLFRLNLKGLAARAMPRYYQISPPAQLKPVTIPRSQGRFVSTRSVISKKTDRPARTEQRQQEVDVNILGPSVTFESLGIGKNMRLFLFAVFGVLGTIETWFWCKAIFVWWKNKTEEDYSSD
ncbi:hypothetical protein N7540_008038 [Penicillium herquei]|nr:hypothetical protein N7540_008038 [Penicillium herquei]